MEMLQTQEVIVVGAGPAGLCCLWLIELGLKPIVIERGRRCVAVVVT
jgi:flavin-dependent dehydrogenase